MINEKIEIHDELNPKIWDGYKLREDVEKKLFDIYDEFINSLEIPINVVDVQIVGSNASYNYTDTSDLDLHIVANLEVDDHDKVLLMLLYNKAREDFNRKYDIQIKGVDVEVYVEDVKSGTTSNGIYSLLRKEWVKKPAKIEVESVDVDKEVSIWNSKISSAIDSKDIDSLKKLLNTLYLVRRNSILTDGEFGKGNLIFKGVRSLGLLDKLKSELLARRSDELSLEALHEDTRGQLLNKSKSSEKGRQRYNKRTKSSISRTVRQYNEIDMNSLFKNNILTVGIGVKGETDDYTVTIKFGGFLDNLNQEVFRNNEILDLRSITQALVKSFNSDNVYIRCSCPDFYYRFGYWASVNDIIEGTRQTIPSEVTNPEDKLGSGCKHILLVLSNTTWLIKIASVINNYIKYMEKYYKDAYAKVIYPAVFRKKYEEPVQTSLFDTDDLVTDKETISNINDRASRETRFQKGNKKGIRFAPKDTQISFEDEEEEEV